MIDFAPIIEQVKPYLWIPLLFISLAILVKRMKANKNPEASAEIQPEQENSSSTEK